MEDQKTTNSNFKKVLIFILRFFLVIIGTIAGFFAGSFITLYHYNKLRPGDHDPGVLTSMMMGSFFGALIGLFGVLLIIKICAEVARKKINSKNRILIFS